MTNTIKDIDLPDRFIVLTGSTHTPPIPKVYLFIRIAHDDWDKFRFCDNDWIFVDNVGYATALEAFLSNDVYMRVIHDNSKFD